MDLTFGLVFSSVSPFLPVSSSFSPFLSNLFFKFKSRSLALIALDLVWVTFELWVTLKWWDEDGDGDGDEDEDEDGDEDEDEDVNFDLFTCETGFVPKWNYICSNFK